MSKKKMTAQFKQEVYDLQCKHDKMKDQYCKDNHIQLIRIPYLDDNINSIKSIISNNL